jgi:hypothetical protein
LYQIILKNKRMLSIKVLLITLSIAVSSIHAASLEAIQVTKQIASKGRSKLNQVLGRKFNLKLEKMVQEFEEVAPDIIDRNMEEVRKELSAKPNLSPRAQHKMASKYGKKATIEIKSKMQSISNVKIPGFSEQTTSLTKRNAILSFLAKASGTILGAVGIGALVFITLVALIALVQFVRLKISQAMARSTYGGVNGPAQQTYDPAPYDPLPYDPYYPPYPYGMY